MQESKRGAGMTSGNRTVARTTFHWALVALLGLVTAASVCGRAVAQENPETAPAGQTPAKPPVPQNGSGTSSAQDKTAPKTHITPDQAKQLFALVAELMKFSS